MKMAILGAGGIAVKMSRTIAQMEGIERTAVAARGLLRAQQFADTYGFRKAYGSYEELLADSEVELVYIALPHSLHCEWTCKALNAGKHVLCEKPLAVNEAEARKMIELAESKKLLLTEAIWTRYMPSRDIIMKLVESGTIGRVRTISANLGYRIFEHDRMTNPNLAGGALLDLTVYPLNFISMVWGDDIRKISASCVYTDTGVDGQDSVMIEYHDGRMANLFTTMYTLTDRMGLICGENGFIQVENINNPKAIRVYSPEREDPKLLASYDVPPQISGYEYEVLACQKAIEEGRIECPEMPHAETIQITCQMDQIRKQFGIVYPFEKNES